MRVTRSLEKIKGKCMSSTQPLISVIVPIYNVEQYLHECVDSILAQTYTNLEIILVNDGSTDNCGKICDEYAEKDNRITVSHKKNGGLSDARNEGVEIAKGELLHFVDSDDWIEADMLELLYGNLIEHNADISCCGPYLNYKNVNVVALTDCGIKVFDSEQAIESWLADGIPWTSACSKLYKKHIFDDIRFPIGKRCEDIFIMTEVMSAANIIVFDSTPKYYYRQRKNSISKEDSYNPNIMHLIEAYEGNLKLIREKYPKLVSLCEYRAILSKFAVHSEMLKFRDCRKTLEYKELLTCLRKNHKNFMSNENFSRSTKIALSTIKINDRFYKFLISIYRYKQNRNGKNLFD